MSQPTLEDYAGIVGEDEIEEIRALARSLAGTSVQHVNSARTGGGVAEILSRLVPLMTDLGLEARWDVISGTPEFFEVTKAFHNALHGQATPITEEMLDTFRQVSQSQHALLDGGEFTIIHDPQPIGLVEHRSGRGDHWIWRCHIDLSEADRRVWAFLRPYVERFDAALFHLPDYARDLPIQQYIVPPAIDPLSDKNKELAEEEVHSVLKESGIDVERPIVLQVSRFDRLKDPVGVIEAFRILRKWHDCQLVLAGGSAADDPEGAQVLEEVRSAADGDPDIIILDLPPTSHVAINALQRAATVVVQKSIKEGFGLVVTEAMWKGKPVVGADVGGIRRQIDHGVTGYLSQTTEGTAFRVNQLLENPALAERIGKAAREYVRANYLITGYLKRWMLVLLSLRHPGTDFVELS